MKDITWGPIVWRGCQSLIICELWRFNQQDYAILLAVLWILLAIDDVK